MAVDDGNDRLDQRGQATMATKAPTTKFAGEEAGETERSGSERGGDLPVVLHRSRWAPIEVHSARRGVIGALEAGCWNRDSPPIAGLLLLLPRFGLLPLPKTFMCIISSTTN
jgi:hypothetical protein